MLIFLSVIALIVCITWWFLEQPKFGRLSSGERWQRIKRSPHYRDGRFHNVHLTPMLADDVSYFTVTRKFFFGKGKLNKPPAPLPSKKTDLLNLNPEENCLVWFGHSSYFIQVDGKKILVDPVFSGAASPVKFTTRSFPGSDVYKTVDLPEIDYLFITHDHWDHLDYQTVEELRNKIKFIVTGLGTAAHFEYWGYDNKIIIEKDWNEFVNLENGFNIHTTHARHFSGRGLRNYRSLWMSFVLKTPSMKIFIGGDSGYDTHYSEIGNQFGPFDLAIVECGQYNEYWKYIHQLPEEAVQAGIDLKTKMVMPVHWGKFSLSMHDWDEPIKRFTAEATKKMLRVIHPMIGEKVNLRNPEESVRWWEDVNRQS